MVAEGSEFPVRHDRIVHYAISLKGYRDLMATHTSEKGNTRIILLEEEIGMRDSLEFAREMKTSAAGPWKILVVVLKCTAINSHCLGTLLATYNTVHPEGRTLRLVANDAAIVKSLAAFRIVPMVPLFDSVENAIAEKDQTAGSTPQKTK